MTNFMKPSAVKAMLSDCKRTGKIFSVTIMKKDGNIRKMVARMDVRKHLKGGVSTIAGRKDLIGVWDFTAIDYRTGEKGAYRSFSTERVIEINANGAVTKAQ